MTNCETCQRIRVKVFGGAKVLLMRFLVRPVQRTLRRVSGSEFIHENHGEMIQRMMTAGAQLEMSLMNHEQATNKYLENLQNRVSYLERQNTQLRDKLREQSGQRAASGNDNPEG